MLLEIFAYGNAASLVEPYASGANQVWQFTSGPGATAAEPAWPGSPALGSTYTDTYTNLWTFMGPKAQYNYSKFIDSPVTNITPQSAKYWANLVRSMAVQLKIVNSATSTAVDTYALPNNAMTLVTVDVVAKQSAGTSSPDGATFSLAGAWFRDSGGAPIQVRAPAVTNSSPNASGTAWTAALSLSGNNVQVTVTGDSTKTITWTASRRGVEGVQL